VTISATADQSSIACAIAVLKKKQSGRIVLATLRDAIEMGHIDSLNPVEVRALVSLVMALPTQGTKPVVDGINEALSA
jgi:hypothetical protein